MSLRCLPPSFGSIKFTVWEDMSFEELQDDRHGVHFGYGNRRTLAILNLYGAPMPYIKFPLNPPYGLGGVLASRWPPWLPSLRSEQNNFSNSESVCHSDACHQVLFGRTCRLKNYLGYWNGMTLAILNPYGAPMPPIKFWLNPTYSLGGDVI